MKEDNNSFKEKWKDKKYQAKVKLSGYGIFVVLIIIILLFGQGEVNNDSYSDDIENNVDNNALENISFEFPNNTNYKYEIELISRKNNIEEVVNYFGTVTLDNKELIKKSDDIINNYKIIDNKYYKLNNNNYILTSIEEVYEINYNYFLDINSINNYLSLSKKDNNIYKVYIKDIILDSNSDKYIEITLKEYSISIDYTNLINILNNNNYDNYIVNIEYE